MRAAAALIAAALVVGPAAAAGERSNEAFVRMLEAQAGVVVSQGDEGGHPFTEWRKNGVRYRLERQSGKEQLTGDDESGHGAVICSWMMYVTLRGELDECPADRFVELRSDLDQGIGAIEDFIVANSVVPMGVTELRARAAAETARIRAASSARPGVCLGGDSGAIAASFDAMGLPARLDMVRDLLSIPRWPVLNPCL